MKLKRIFNKAAKVLLLSTALFTGSIGASAGTDTLHAGSAPPSKDSATPLSADNAPPSGETSAACSILPPGTRGAPLSQSTTHNPAFKEIGVPDRRTPEKSILTDAEELIARTPRGRDAIELAHKNNFYWGFEETAGQRVGESFLERGELVIDPRYGASRSVDDAVLTDQQKKQLKQRNISEHDIRVAFWAATFMHEIDHMNRLKQTGYSYGVSLNVVKDGQEQHMTFTGIDDMGNQRLLELLAQHTAFSWAIELANAPGGDALPLALYGDMRNYPNDMKFLQASNAAGGIDLEAYASVFFDDYGESHDWNGGGGESFGSDLLTTEKDIVCARQFIAQPILPEDKGTLSPSKLTTIFMMKNGGADYMISIANDYLVRMGRPLTESEKDWIVYAHQFPNSDRAPDPNAAPPPPPPPPPPDTVVVGDAGKKVYNLLDEAIRRIYPVAGQALASLSPDDTAFVYDHLLDACNSLSATGQLGAQDQKTIEGQKRALEAARAMGGQQAAYAFYGVRDVLLAFVYPQPVSAPVSAKPLPLKVRQLT